MAEPSVDIRLVEVSRLQPAAWNPRTIKDERFQNLCASIQADPGFLWRRPILAMADGTIYAGSMRYRAAVHLGMTAVPAVVEDVPERLAKERALRDNHQWGDWQDDQLASLLGELAVTESDLSLLGVTEAELAWLFGNERTSPHQTDGGQGGETRNIGREVLVKAVLTPVDVALFEGDTGGVRCSERTTRVSERRALSERC
jgi:ParB-like chromosome segregation protein Spo0J